MKYIDEFRNEKDSRNIIKKIESLPLGDKHIRLMEVCGTHTMAISRHGIRSLMPENVELLSGPGCPVCVTPGEYLDRALELSKREDLVITTFGDMVKVPGSSGSLRERKAGGDDISVVSSPREALKTAQKEQSREVVFLGVGFETTAPTVGASILKADELNLDNYSVLSAHKLIPPAMRALVDDEKVNVSGFICPAHVSAVIGTGSYDFLAGAFSKPCVVTGFEPSDILQGIYMLLKQICEEKSEVENEYSRVVKEEGNEKAQDIIQKVFEIRDTRWRGLGTIENSGLDIRDEFSGYDASVKFPVEVSEPTEPEGCICGAVLRGVAKPGDCRLFDNRCTPESPVGPCMVSSEGTCAAYYRFEIRG